MGLFGTLGAAMTLADRLLGRLWGSQTFAEAALLRRGEEAAKKVEEAIDLLHDASARGDYDAMAMAMDAVNGWRSELRRVRDALPSHRS